MIRAILIILVGYCSGKHRVNYGTIGHMKHLVLVMIVGVLVGCGKEDSVQPNMPNPKASQPTTANSYTANTKPKAAKAKVIVGGKLWEFETGGRVTTPLSARMARFTSGQVMATASSMPSMARLGSSYGNLKRDTGFTPPPPLALMARFGREDRKTLCVQWQDLTILRFFCVLLPRHRI